MKTKTTAKWVVVLGILVAQLPLNLSAQSAPQVDYEVTHQSQRGLPQNITFTNQSTNVFSPSAGSIYLLQKLGLESPYNFKLINENSDKLGMTHYRYRLTYNNYPVENTMYLLHTKSGVAISANGDFVNDINLQTGTVMAEEKAIEVAYKSENLVYSTTIQNWVKANLKKAAEMKIIYHEASKSYKLVYDVKVVASIGHQHEVAIDAINGDVVRKQSPFSCAKGHTIYSGERQITTMDSAGKYWLVDKTRGIRTFDAEEESTQGQEPANAKLVSGVTDEWKKEDHETGAVDAHFSAQAAYDYFLNVHGRKSYDGNGGEIRSYVNVDIGEQPNAFWGGFMVISKPINGILLATLDIVCHEISHGVSLTSAEFGRQGESGALGEAYSDMFGSLIEKMMYPNYPDSLNYQTGEQFTELGRDFINPGRFNNPRYYKGDNWDASDQDAHKNGNLHTHWMYLVAEGDANYVNEKNETFNIKGLGRDKVGDIIFRTLTVYLTPEAGYAESMRYSIQAAKDLYGACSDEVATVKTVWQAVGLEVDADPNANAEFTVSESRCISPIQYTFVNSKGSNRNYTWNYGDGTTSTDVTPTKTYAANGEYKVKLSVEGCSGDANTYEMTVVVDNDQKCDSNTMALNGKESTESCTGLLSSKLDANGVYEANNTTEYTIRNANNSPYEIEFTKFDMGYFSDRIEIYDGIGVNGTKLGEFSVMSPPTSKLVSTTGAVTFKETSDGFSDYDGTGFEIFYKCDKNSSTNSVQNATVNTLKIWPNPASQNLNIYNENGIKAYTITDISGRTIEQAKVNATNTNINLSTYTNGMYFINVITNKGIFTEKVIVQHN